MFEFAAALGDAFDLRVVGQGEGGERADVAVVGQVKFGTAGGWQVERGVVRLDEADLQARAVVAHAPGEGELACVVQAETRQDGLPVAGF